MPPYTNIPHPHNLEQRDEIELLDTDMTWNAAIEAAAGVVRIAQAAEREQVRRQILALRRTVNNGD